MNAYWKMTVRTLQREYLPYNRLASTQPTSPVCTLQHFRESQQRNPYLGLNIQRCIRAPSRFAFRFETRATKVNATSYYLKFAFELFRVVINDGLDILCSSSLIKSIREIYYYIIPFILVKLITID